MNISKLRFVSSEYFYMVIFFYFNMLYQSTVIEKLQMLLQAFFSSGFYLVSQSPIPHNSEKKPKTHNSGYRNPRKS